MTTPDEAEAAILRALEGGPMGLCHVEALLEYVAVGRGEQVTESPEAEAAILRALEVDASDDDIPF